MCIFVCHYTSDDPAHPGKGGVSLATHKTRVVPTDSDLSVEVVSRERESVGLAAGGRRVITNVVA